MRKLIFLSSILLLGCTSIPRLYSAGTTQDLKKTIDSLYGKSNVIPDTSYWVKLDMVSNSGIIRTYTYHHNKARRLIITTYVINGVTYYKYRSE